MPIHSFIIRYSQMFNEWREFIKRDKENLLDPQPKAKYDVAASSKNSFCEG